MLLQFLIAYITLTAAKRDTNEDFHAQSTPEELDRHYGLEKEKMILKERENFTKCDEFLNGTTLDLKKVFDVDWMVFYYWVDKKEIVEIPNFIKFQVPSPTLVSRFKGELTGEIEAVNWTASEIFMETTSDFSAILLATNRSGLFDIVPSIGFQHKLKDLHDYHMALKTVGPYVGLMNCRYRQLLALCPANMAPKGDKVESIAKLFKFKSDLGISLVELEKIKKAESIKDNIRLNEILVDDRKMYEYDDPDYKFTIL